MLKPKRMTKEELISAVEDEFTNALGRQETQVARERARSWNFYNSEPFGDEEEGQSKIVTSDVSDCVDGIMPSLLRLFTTAENLVSFDPVGPEDVEAASQESDYVNYVFFKQNPAFLILYTWFFDALLQKNGIVKCCWNESKEITYETYENLDDASYALLLDEDDLEEVEHEEEAKTETVTAPDPMTGQPVEVEVSYTVHSAKFKRVRKDGFAEIVNVPPEEYRISRDSRTVDPCDARMVGQEREMTRSELINDLGLSVKEAYELTGYKELLTEERLARYSDQGTEELDDNPPEDSEEKVNVKEAYIRVDFDGDGTSELRHVIICNKKVLVNERFDRQPFHVLCPQPLPHKHFGRSIADRVMDIQRVNSELLRQTVTNLYHTNNPGHAIWEQGIGEDTLDDLLTTRIGRVARFRKPVDQSYRPMEVPFTAGASFPMMEYFDKLKRDRTGVSSDSEGLSPEALKNIQTTAMSQALDMSRMKIEAIARIFAETGIKSLMLHIHELLMKHQDKQQVVQLRNEWVQVDPREWLERNDMTVKIGLGIGSRETNLVHLNAIWEKQAQMVEGGGLGLTVTPQNLYQTASELVKNANLKNPNQFFTDPGDQQAPPPSDEQMQLQQQAQELEAQRQELQARQQQLDSERQMIAAQKQELEAQKMIVKAEQDQTKMMLDMQAKNDQLRLDREKQQQDMLIEMEKMSNQLTEMELKYATNVPGSKV